MCAKCGCGCKSGKPEKNCKCNCPTCKEAKNSKHESEESEYEDEEVEKAAYKMSALRGLQESFKAGKEFGRAGVKNAMSPYGKNKVKTAGFRAGSAAGRTGKFVSENPGKSALIAGGAVGAGVAANKAIKKSAFGVDADYISKADKPGALNPKNEKYARNVVLADMAGNTLGGSGLVGPGINAYNAKKGRKAAVFGRTYGRNTAEGLGGLAGGSAAGAGIGAGAGALIGRRMGFGAKQGAKIGGAVGGYGGAVGGALAGMAHGTHAATKNAIKRGDIKKSGGVSAFGVQH